MIGISNLRIQGLSAIFYQMKSITTYEFLRQFTVHRKEPCQVKARGQVVGTWLPVPKNPEPIDFAQRVRQDFKAKLPFTGAELLKAGKKR
jgi:hypothetical protein